MEIIYNMQKGSALIMALLITAIVATIATVLAVNLRILTHESQLVYNFRQAYRDLQGLQYWGEAQLIENAKFSIEKNIPENYPQVMPSTLFQQAKLSGEIDDAQGLFNINSLINPAAQPQFIRLLKAIDGRISTVQATQITQAITNWLNVSNVDTVYLQNRPPYRASHQPMVSLSELRLINGVSAKLYMALAPYVTVLPSTNNEINIMTAPVPVLQSLGSNITTQQAANLASCRQQYFTTGMDNLKQNCISKPGLQLDPNINILSMSNYFWIKGYANLGSQDLALYTLVKRNAITQNNEVSYTADIVWQSLNTW